MGESFMVRERNYKKMPCDMRNMASPSGSRVIRAQNQDLGMKRN